MARLRIRKQQEKSTVEQALRSEIAQLRAVLDGTIQQAGVAGGNPDTIRVEIQHSGLSTSSMEFVDIKAQATAIYIHEGVTYTVPLFNEQTRSMMAGDTLTIDISTTLRITPNA